LLGRGHGMPSCRCFLGVCYACCLADGLPRGTVAHNLRQRRSGGKIWQRKHVLHVTKPVCLPLTIWSCLKAQVPGSLKLLRRLKIKVPGPEA
jgi:hypothetical protein